MKHLASILLLLCASTAHAQLWTADHEERDLTDWSKSVNSSWAGGNLSDNTGASTTVVTAGTGHVVKMTITGAYGTKRGCRLLRAKDDAGNYFPKTAYYTTWMYIPANYKTYAWWNVCQFKGQRPDNSTSDPIITYNLEGDGSTGYRIYLYNHLTNQSYSSGTRFTAGKWVKLEVLFTWDTANGAVKLSQNGQVVINKTGIKTKASANDKFLCWGPANYTDKISGPDGNGNATVYFDSASVRTGP